MPGTSELYAAVGRPAAIGAGSPSDHRRPRRPGDRGGCYWNRFADSVETLSEGRLGVRLMIRGEIGPEETLFSHLRRGRRVQLAGISTSAVSPVLPELDILRVPFMFDSIEEVGYVLDEHLKAPVQEMLLEHDLVMIDWMSAGWLNLYAKFPIKRPQDIVARRMRINVSDTARMFMEAIGSDIVPISFADVVPSLQTGLIDGGEQSTQLFVTGGIARFAPHFTHSRHAYLAAVIIANRDWFETLAPGDQQIYRRSIPSDRWYRAFFSEGNAVALADAVTRGLNVYELSPDDRAAWRAGTAGLAEELIDRIGGRTRDLYQIILDGKAAFAAQSAGSN